jgi:hypothetical protein
VSQYGECCKPSKLYLPAIHEITEAIMDIKGLRAPFQDYIPDSLDELDQVFRRRWGLAAIMHDAAYPLELAAKQMHSYWNEALYKDATRMSCCDNPFSFSLNHCCDLMAAPRLQQLCSVDIDCNMYSDNIATMLATNISNKLHSTRSPATLADMMVGQMKSSLDSGIVDHGVFSASLFLKSINAELRENPKTDYGVVTSSHNADKAEYFYLECVDAAAAMYLHNTKRHYALFMASKMEYAHHPIAWLLFLCDQLQEWLRPSGAHSEPEALITQACKYCLTVADGSIFYKFPPDANPEAIKAGIGEHLLLFGNSAVKHAR